MSRKREKLRKESLRFSKFTVVGFSNAVVDVAALNFFLWLAPTRDLAALVLCNAVALVLANANSYVWNAHWTFRGRTEHDRRQKALFALQALVNISISLGLFFFLVRPILDHTDLSAHMAGNVAKIASVVAASIVSFFLMRYLVFSPKRWPGGRL